MPTRCRADWFRRQQQVAPGQPLLLVVCALHLLSAVCGQGLVSEPSLGASGRAAETHRYAMQRAKRLQQQWASMTPRSCSKGKGTLCGQDVSDQGEYLSIMSSPAVYDARNPDHTGGVNLVNRPGSQGDCNACVAFAVTAAAESAVAAGLHVDVTSFPRFSPRYFFFCAGKGTSCNKGWNLDDALALLTEGASVKSDKCYLWTQAADEESVCTLKCGFGEARIPLGSFTYTRLPNEAMNSVARAQRHIRRWGGVITRFALNMEDLRAFVKRSPDGIYNLTDQAALNSCGPFSGTGGVAYGAAETLVPEYTYGIKWKPFDSEELPGTPSKSALTPAVQPGCVRYKAQRGDYAERVADAFSIPLEQLLSDNLPPVIPLDNPGAFLTGKVLTICGSTVAAGLSNVRPKPATTPTAAKPPSSPHPQADADQQRAALLTCAPCHDWWGDAPPVHLTSGGLPPPKNNSAVHTPTCQLNGVTCGTDGVTVITLNMAERVLLGELPAAFGKLTGLTSLDFHSNKMTGTLHAEWATLKSLEYLDLHDNEMSGVLPEAWGKGLRSLNMLDLSSNQLSGTLPAAWSAMTLETLLLHDNKLTGTIPTSWGNMQTLILVSLHTNAGLSGCVPRSWQGHVQFMDVDTDSYTQELSPGVVKGTKLKQWCPA